MSIYVYAYIRTYLFYNQKNFLIFSQFRPDMIRSALDTDCEQANEESLGNECMVLCVCKNDINSYVNKWILSCSPTYSPREQLMNINSSML